MSKRLSIIVISYNNERELPRTLLSLCASYQRGIMREDYEVIVVDNGSISPPQKQQLSHLNMDIRIEYMKSPSKSPVPAINLGMEIASGDTIGIMIDGARLASPGLLTNALAAQRVSDRAFVGSRGRYLGPDFQSRSMKKGYNQRVEDQLLDRIDWTNNGYRLFGISVFDESSGPTWFDLPSESNALFMPRPLWKELGGYDPAFVSPGGGLVNLDTWLRACHLPNSIPILLMGEATFHQIHGGIATNCADQVKTFIQFNQEYRSIRGDDWQWPNIPVTYYGAFQTPPRPREMFTSRFSHEYQKQMLLKAWRKTAIQEKSFFKHSYLRLLKQNSLKAR